MKLVIRDREFDLFTSITDATLADLVRLRTDTEAAGHPVTPARLREYLMSDVLQSAEPFAYVDTPEKIVCYRALIWLAWATGGNPQPFAETEKVRLSDVTVRVEESDVQTDPKDGTGSAADGGAATPT